jgi:protein phosphatase
MTCLIVQEDTCFQLNNYCVVIKSHLGKFADVDYYKVNIQEATQTNFNINFDSTKLGLLRIGNLNGGLSSELQLRHVLKESRLISKLLTFSIEEVGVLSSIATEDRLDSASYSSFNTELVEEFASKPFTNNCSDISQVNSPQLIDNSQETFSNESDFNRDWEVTED